MSGMGFIDIYLSNSIEWSPIIVIFCREYNVWLPASSFRCACIRLSAFCFLNDACGSNLVR